MLLRTSSVTPPVVAVSLTIDTDWAGLKPVSENAAVLSERVMVRSVSSGVEPVPMPASARSTLPPASIVKPVAPRSVSGEAEEAIAEPAEVAESETVPASMPPPLADAAT